MGFADKLKSYGYRSLKLMLTQSSKLMMPKFKSSLRVACHSFGGTICAGAVLFIATNVQAQNLFESDYGSGQINEFSPGGSQSTFASGLNQPVGLAFNNAGNLYEADANSGNIYEFTPAGTQSTFASGLGDLMFWPLTMPAICLWQMVIPATSINSPRVECQAPLPPGCRQPVGLAFDSAGNLFVSDYTSDDIYEFTPGGAQSTFASGLNGPWGLAFDSAGNLFEADSGTGNIYEFTPGGVQSTFASGLDYPVGLAFDSAGNLFEGDFTSGNIYEFTPGGVQSTFASGLDGPTHLAFQSEVPEPSVLGLLALGVTALLIRYRRNWPRAHGAGCDKWVHSAD